MSDLDHGPRGRLADQLTFAEQDQALLPITADQNKPAMGIKNQGLQHRQPSLRAAGLQPLQPLQDLWRKTPEDDDAQADQSQGDGQGEDHADDVEQMHIGGADLNRGERPISLFLSGLG